MNIVDLMRQHDAEMVRGAVRVRIGSTYEVIARLNGGDWMLTPYGATLAADKPAGLKRAKRVDSPVKESEL